MVCVPTNILMYGLSVASGVIVYLLWERRADRIYIKDLRNIIDNGIREWFSKGR
jgi:hypothetical protein